MSTSSGRDASTARSSRARRGGERGAGGVLRARRDDQRLARADDLLQFARAAVPDRRRPPATGTSDKRAQQIEDAGERRILDGHAIAGTEVLAQDALDAVERAADDGDVIGGDAVRAELLARQLEQPRVVELLAVQTRHGSERRSAASASGSRAGIGIAVREIAHAGGQRHLARNGDRRRRTDACAAPSIGGHDAAVLQQPVGRGDRGRAHAAAARRRCAPAAAARRPASLPLVTAPSTDAAILTEVEPLR